jgi:hypothetical protein
MPTIDHCAVGGGFQNDREFPHQYAPQAQTENLELNEGKDVFNLYFISFIDSNQIHTCWAL